MERKNKNAPEILTVGKESTAFKIFRIALTLTAVFFLLCFIAPVMTGIVNIGNISGGALCLWIIFVFGTRNSYNTVKSWLKKHLVTKILLYSVNFCFATLLCYGIAVSACMIAATAVQPKANATAVVLGAEVNSRGPSTILRGRINAALKYLNENPEAKAVLTGGQGSNEPMSEAQAMYDELVKAGISPDRLYIEDRATNTDENIEYSMEIIYREGLNPDIAIATDSFHQLRAHIIAGQKEVRGRVGSINADTFPPFVPTFAVREWFALPYQVLFR